MYFMNRIKILISVFALTFIFFLAPFVVSAAGLVPCGTEVYPEGQLVDGKGVGGMISNPCDWHYLIVGITNVTNYFIILGAAISALAFGYAGLLMMTANGEMGKIEEAKSIFGKVLVGFLIMLSAWLIVHAIEAAFIAPESGIKSLLQG